MDIPLDAKVECTDGACGRSEFVLINPILDQVTHLVVKEDSPSNTEYIVPVDCVTETVNDTIRLRFTRAELEKMEPFLVTKVIEEKVPERVYPVFGMYGVGSFYYLPYVSPAGTVTESVEEQHIPPGELSIHRGTRVEATDGYVGKVDEFVVNPGNGHISHFLMREGHLWGKKEVIIPLSAMGETRADTVFLTIDKHQIESLTTFPVQRRWS